MGPAGIIRFFSGKTARDIGERMGVTEDAAQKRVSRALESLKKTLARHGIAVGSASLAATLSANAFQTAPAGFAAGVAALAASAASQTTAGFTLFKLIAINTVQKTMMGAALAATVGAGMWQAHEASSLRSTDGARKKLEDMFVRMAETSKGPDRDQMIQMVLDHKLGVEDGLLMPMVAENQQRNYASYNIVSSQSVAEDQRLLQLETVFADGSSKTEKLKLRQVGSDWRVVIDEDFLAGMH